MATARHRGMGTRIRRIGTDFSLGFEFDFHLKTPTFVKIAHNMNAESSSPKDLTIAQFLTLFSRFSSAEQKQIALAIWEKTFAGQWRLLDRDLPDIEISEAEIQEELRAVRYGESGKN